MGKKIISLILILIIAAGAFPGCSSDEKIASKEEVKKKSAAFGGTLRLACVSCDTLNPIVTKHASVSDFLSLIYEGLFVLKEDQSVEGVLADSYTASANNTVYTIKLKENIRFHNGRIFTSADVVATLNYMALYSERYSEFMKYIAGYSADGSNGIVIKLNSSKTDFMNNFDFPILPAGLKSDDFIASNLEFVPNGTGIYEYDTTVARRNIILKAYDDWHGGEKKAYIENVNIEILSDEDTIISAFDSGIVDALTTSWRSFGDLELTSSMYRTFENEQNRFSFIGINCQNENFDTASERKGILNCVDREKIAHDIMLGHAVPANSPVREKAYYNNPNDEATKEEAAKENEKAKTVDCRLLYNSDSKTKTRLAVAVKQQLESSGYAVTLDGQPFSTYSDMVALGKYELYIGEVMLTGSCDMQFMFSSPMSGICNYDDGEFRALVTNLDIASGSEDKKQSWQSFERHYRDSAIQVPLYFTNKACFINKRIRGKLTPNLSVPYYGIENMYIEMQ
jgi:peptide/nickel transport system substrate-binding protein